MLLEQGFYARVVDDCIEGKKGIEKALAVYAPDILGVTCLTPVRKKSLEAAQTAKAANPATKVVLGGAHATIMFRQLLKNYPFIDCVVLGEGEMTILEIARGMSPEQINGLAYRKDGRVVKTAPRQYIADLDRIPLPAWHLVDLKKYRAWGEGH